MEAEADPRASLKAPHAHKPHAKKEIIKKKDNTDGEGKKAVVRRSLERLHYRRGQAEKTRHICLYEKIIQKKKNKGKNDFNYLYTEAQ